MVEFVLFNMGEWGTKNLCYKQTVNDWNLSNGVTFKKDLDIFLFSSLKIGSTGDCSLAMTKGGDKNKKFCAVK